MFTEEKIMSYIDGKIDDKYYIDFYKEVAIGNEAELMPQEDLDTINSSLDTVINILNIEEEMINLLKDNKGTWTIENGMIMFSSDSVLTTYNDLVTELQSVANILLQCELKEEFFMERIRLSNITKNYGDRKIFEIPDLIIRDLQIMYVMI